MYFDVIFPDVFSLLCPGLSCSFFSDKRCSKCLKCEGKGLVYWNKPPFSLVSRCQSGPRPTLQPVSRRPRKKLPWKSRSRNLIPPLTVPGLAASCHGKQLLADAGEQPHSGASQAGVPRSSGTLLANYILTLIHKTSYLLLASIREMDCSLSFSSSFGVGVVGKLCCLIWMPRPCGGRWFQVVELRSWHYLTSETAGLNTDQTSQAHISLQPCRHDRPAVTAEICFWGVWIQWLFTHLLGQLSILLVTGIAIAIAVDWLSIVIQVVERYC